MLENPELISIKSRMSELEEYMDAWPESPIKKKKASETRNQDLFSPLTQILTVDRNTGDITRQFAYVSPKKNGKTEMVASTKYTDSTSTIKRQTDQYTNQLYSNIMAANQKVTYYSFVFLKW